MAGLSSSKDKYISYDIDFDGALLSSTRASLVIELIKYLLYERQQVPLPIDQLTLFVNNNSKVERTSSSETLTSSTEVRKESRHIIHIESSAAQKRFDAEYFHSNHAVGNVIHPKDKILETDSGCTCNCHGTKQAQMQTAAKPAKELIENSCLKPHTRPSCWSSQTISSLKTQQGLESSRAPSVKNSTIQKTQCLIKDLTQTFDNLKKAFEVCPEIEQVAVLLGGTIVSPKESYLINFPPTCPDADCLPFIACKTTLFKQVISEDIFGVHTKTLSPTSMMLLLSAPRSCPLEWFLPKISYTSPRIGTVVSLNFHCSYLVPTCHDLTIVGAEIELSGIELLDCSLCEKDSQSLENESSLQENKDACEFVINSRHKACSGGDKFSHQETPGEANGCVSRFCVHQRLNYIYSNQKKKEKAQQEKLSQNASPDSAAHSSQSTDSDEKDLLWYQSPLVIKGFNLQ